MANSVLCLGERSVGRRLRSSLALTLTGDRIRERGLRMSTICLFRHAVSINKHALPDQHARVLDENESLPVSESAGRRPPCRWGGP